MRSSDRLLPGAIAFFIGALVVIGIGFYMLQNASIVSAILFLMALIALAISATMYRTYRKR